MQMDEIGLRAEHVDGVEIPPRLWVDFLRRGALGRRAYGEEKILAKYRAENLEDLVFVELFWVSE